MTFNGTEFKVFIIGTPNKEIYATRDLSLEITMSSIDVSHRGSGGWKEVLAGQRAWSCSLSGIVDYAPPTGQVGYQELQTLAVNRAPIQVMFGRNTTGSYQYTGTGVLTSASISGTYEDAVTWTSDIEGSGALLPAVVA